MRQKHWAKLIGIGFAAACLIWQGLVPQAFSATAPGVTDDTILIGITAPMTGAGAIYAKAAEMTETIFLEWGKGIHGRNIKVIRYDDACDPVKGIAAYKKLLYDDKVFMIMGGLCSNQVLAAKPMLESTGIPYMGIGGSAESIYIPTVKNIFTPIWTSRVTAESMADFAMTIPKATRFGVIRHTDEWATSQYNILVDYLKKKYSKDLTVDVTLERGVADATSQILRLKQGNLDAVFALLFPADTSNFLREANRLGLDVNILLGAGTSVSEQYDSLRSQEPLKKAFGPYVLKYPLDHPKVKVYEEMYKKHFPNSKFDAWPVLSTGGPLVIIDAFKKAGRDLTWEKFIDLLETQYTNWEPNEFIGAVPLTFSKTDHIGMHGSATAILADGKLTIIKTYADYQKLRQK